MRDTAYDGMSDLLTTAQRLATTATATAAWSDLRTAGGNHLSEVADSVHDHAQAAVHLIDPTNGAAFHEDRSYTFTAQFVTANDRLTPAGMDESAASVREAHGSV